MFRKEAETRDTEDLAYVDKLGPADDDSREFEDVEYNIEEAVADEPQQEEDEKIVFTGKELLEMKVKEMPTLVAGLLPKTGIVALAGSSDTGKSAFLRQLAGDIACKETQFLGFDIKATHNSVIVVSTEDDKYAISYLLGLQHNDSRKEDLYENLRYIFETDNLIQLLDKELKERPADCVIIDTFSDLYGGDMNQANKVRSFLSPFRSLSLKYGCLFIFLHHTGKRTELQPPSKDNLVGSQGFESKMRLVIELRRDSNDPAIRHMCIVKGNYQKETNKRESLVLMFGDQMRYTATQERVAFDRLVKSDPSKAAKNEAKERALMLKLQGLTIEQVTEAMNKEGFQVKRSTVGSWLKGISYPSIQPSLLLADTGQPEEEQAEE